MKKIFIGINIGILLAVIAWGSFQWYKDAEKRKEMEANISAASIEPVQLIIDTQEQTGSISPLLFGGTHSPLINHLDAWTQIKDVGVTVIRRDFFMEQIVPSNISLEDYKANKNDIQNPDKWNKVMIRAAGERYRLAKSSGMKTMGIVDYTPKWLTHSGSTIGVPKDWNVFEDIVKKHYKMFRNDLDYIEAWNEPTFERFNDPKNSGLSMEQAYVQIATHIIQAVREVDQEANDGKRIKIGGLVADNPDRTDMLRALLQDPYIKSELDFISYHTYDHPEPTDKKYREILEEYGLGDMPLFVTEWNIDPKEKELSPYKSENPAILYTAEKLLTMIENGITGANYYMMEPINFDTPGIGKKYMGFYKIENNTTQLLPQARTWRLLSKKLSLGEGDSIVVNHSDIPGLKIVSFINSKRELGVAIVNSSSSYKVLSLQFKGLENPAAKNIKVYNASGSNDATEPLVDLDIPAKNNIITHSVYIPEETVVGVILSDNISIFNHMRYNILPH